MVFCLVPGNSSISRLSPNYFWSREKLYPYKSGIEEIREGNNCTMTDIRSINLIQKLPPRGVLSKILLRTPLGGCFTFFLVTSFLILNCNSFIDITWYMFYIYHRVLGSTCPLAETFCFAASVGHHCCEFHSRLGFIHHPYLHS